MVQIEKGNHSRKISELKIVLTLIILKLRGPIGRYRLKEMLSLSEREGIVRLMLSDLKQEGFLRTGKIGCALTPKGEGYLKKILEKYGVIDIREMNLEPLRIGPENFVIQIRGHHINQSITELRDVAVRAGASGIVLIVYEKGILQIPPIYSDLEREYPKLATDFHETLILHDGDTIIACFSRDKWQALEGGLSVAIVLAKP
ncbi:MAG: hypothetical protein QG670_1670 [Thermoproteota archaeon]|nr:hypothetical protein [Thermoproteota archaeon]